MKKIPKLIFSVALTVIVALVAYFKLEHIIAFNEQGTLFLYDSDFWRSFSGRPMGLLQYATSFVTQFFHFRILGALLLGLLFGLSYHMVISRAKSRVAIILALIPLLYFFLGYMEAQIMFGFVALFINVLMYWGWSFIPKRYSAFIAPFVFMVGYAVTGIMFVTSVILIIGGLLGDKPRKIWQWGAIGALCAIAYFMPHIGAVIYSIPSSAAASLNINNIGEIARFDMTYHILWVVCVLGGALLPAESILRYRWLCPALFSVVIAFFGYKFFADFNSKVKEIMVVTQAADREDWRRVIELAEKFEHDNIVVTYLYNVAIFRAGQFNDRLFDMPQKYAQRGLFFEFDAAQKVTQGQGDLVFANVGIPCEAHRWAYESMVNRGENAVNFKKIIRYNRRMGRHDVAQRYVELLDRSLFHKANDRETLAPSVNSRCADSVFTINKDLAWNLKNVIDADSKNRGAFEYLAASCLMTNQLYAFAEMVPMALKIYEGRLPRIYDEALMVYRSAVGEEKFAKLGYAPSVEVQHRFSRFTNAYSQANINPKQSLKVEYGKTYWYYISFFSPHGLKIY